MMTAAHLQHFDRAPPLFAAQNISQNYDIICNEFFKPMTRELAIFGTAFGRHQHGQTVLLQRAADMEELAPEDFWIADKVIEELSEGIEDDSFGPHRRHGVFDAGKQRA